VVVWRLRCHGLLSMPTSFLGYSTVKWRASGTHIIDIDGRWAGNSTAGRRCRGTTFHLYRPSKRSGNSTHTAEDIHGPCRHMKYTWDCGLLAQIPTKVFGSILPTGVVMLDYVQELKLGSAIDLGCRLHNQSYPLLKAWGCRQQGLFLLRSHRAPPLGHSCCMVVVSSHRQIGILPSSGSVTMETRMDLEPTAVDDLTHPSTTARID